MKVTEAGIDLIKYFERCRLIAYPDPGSGSTPYTIGWGSIMRRDGTKFKQGDRISQSEADELLAWEVGLKSVGVANLLKPQIVNDNQFSALVSFAYNLGLGNLEKSTLLKKVKANPSDPLIADEFQKWNKASGKIMLGLVKRRKKESDLYFT